MTSFSFLSPHRETSTLLESSILTREFWTQIRVQRAQIYTENRLHCVSQTNGREEPEVAHTDLLAPFHRN